MGCLIIGIIWVIIRFVAGTIAYIFDYHSKFTIGGCFVWVLGWIINIALLIIGACTV